MEAREAAAAVATATRDLGTRKEKRRYFFLPQRRTPQQLFSFSRFLHLFLSTFISTHDICQKAFSPKFVLHALLVFSL